MMRSFKLKKLFSTLQNWSKVKVTRLPNQKVALFVESTATLDSFLLQINHAFPSTDTQLLVSTHSHQNIIDEKIDDSMLKMSEDSKKQIFLDLIMTGEFQLHQIRDRSVELTYGIQISEMSFYTGNRNISENVDRNISSLATALSESATIAQVISKSETRSEQTIKQLALQKQYYAEVYNKSYQHLMETERFMQNRIIQEVNNPLMMKLTGLLIVNFGAMAYITYGKYGWDVGEPVSYLSSLFVDLLAMVGLFNLNQKLESDAKLEFSRICSINNLQAKHQYYKWILSYYRRRLI